MSNNNQQNKNLYIIAGVNGAGKTTAFRNMLSEEMGNPIFVNPDIIARQINPDDQWGARMAAGRETLRQINENMEQGNTFCIETTLATRSYVGLVKRAREKGYRTHLYYFWLESAEASFRRVQQRVKEGSMNAERDNHSIPEDIIKERYPKSVDNFFNLYIPIVDNWHLLDNNLGMALPIADTHEVYDPTMWDIIRRRDPEHTASSININKLIDNIGIMKFAQTVLLEKFKNNENVVYSIEGKVVEFNPMDILWLILNFHRSLEDWEIIHLRKLAAQGKEQYYTNGMHFPASMVLRLYGVPLQG